MNIIWIEIFCILLLLPDLDCLLIVFVTMFQILDTVEISATSCTITLWEKAKSSWSGNTLH